MALYEEWIPLEDHVFYSVQNCVWAKSKEYHWMKHSPFDPKGFFRALLIELLPESSITWQCQSYVDECFRKQKTAINSSIAGIIVIIV